MRSRAPPRSPEPPRRSAGRTPASSRATRSTPSRCPFAWTPPGQGVRRHRARADGAPRRGRGAGGKGRWAGASTSHATFRRSTKGDDPLSVLPREVREPLGAEGVGALTFIGERGPVVVPVRWRADEHALYAALPAETLALAVAGPDVPAALTVDEASEWRARDMVGAMVQGTASIYVLDALGSGAKSARALATEIDPDAGALVRLAPSRDGVVARLVQRERRRRHEHGGVLRRGRRVPGAGLGGREQPRQHPALGATRRERAGAGRARGRTPRTPS